MPTFLRLSASGIGTSTWAVTARLLAVDGRLLVIGVAAGGIPTATANRLLLRNVSVVG